MSYRNFKIGEEFAKYMASTDKPEFKDLEQFKAFLDQFEADTYKEACEKQDDLAGKVF